MNPLESLKERLKHKPEVRPNPGVKVILAPQIDEKVVIEEKTKPLITAEKDEGKRAKDILEKIRQKKLSAVIKKLPEETKEPIMSQAPPIPETKKTQPKKLPKEFIVLEEEKVKNTIIDFYLLSLSNSINSYSSYEHGSGFSYWCAKTYDIPYSCKYITI